MTEYAESRVRELVSASQEELFARYAVGRPPNWSCDSRTRELVCVGNWLDDELKAQGVSDDDRRATLWSFNRRSRAAFELFQLAADIMNEVLAGTVDNKPAHRRWG